MVVRWLAEAEDDLRAIYNYIRSDAGESTARRVVERIIRHADRLGTMPMSAPVELLLENRDEGFRSKVVRRTHKIVYFIKQDDLYIAAVFDCRRDPAVLKDKVGRNFL